MLAKLADIDTGSVASSFLSGFIAIVQPEIYGLWMISSPVLGL
jgi:hypothetical protein